MQREFESWHVGILAERETAEDDGSNIHVATNTRVELSGNGGLLGLLQSRNNAQKHDLGNSSSREPAAPPVQAWPSRTPAARSGLGTSAKSAALANNAPPTHPFLTGNAEADADILAFYQAKAEIVQELGQVK